MGIDLNSAKLLLAARRQGVDFSRPLTIGRLGLHLPVAGLQCVLGQFGIHRSLAESAAMYAECDGYAEPFFRLLGTTELASLDVSEFEGATLIHDLNVPAPREWHGRYSVVFDGGTLEHVFNFPTALRSCMEMVAVGGHFIMATPANNQFGHGFYQFSPELFARALSPANGFELEKMLVFESVTGRWHEVVDPAKAGGRVTLVNSQPTFLAAWARRTSQVEIFANLPQQSDYSAEWSEFDGQPRKCREAERQQKPALRRVLRRVKKWLRPRYPSKYFKPVDLAA